MAGSGWDVLLAGGRRADRVRHVERRPAREGRTVPWPDWVPAPLHDALVRAGVALPWAHQVAAADLARAGQHLVVATGTASGKTLAFWLPALTEVLRGAAAPDGRGATALYLSPTKALAHDQLRAVTGLGLPALRAAAYDGDTPREERAWVRAHAGYVLTNPDMLHRSLLPGQAAWGPFLRSLRFVIVDECHTYRGVFGAHVSAVLRRLRRACARHGADPVLIGASATTADPGQAAARLFGVPVTVVDADQAPRSAARIALWEPPLVPAGDTGALVRRGAAAETADLLADLVVAEVPTLAFVRSRRSAEAVASWARARVAEVAPHLAGSVAAYRGGYLPEERRALERDLRSGTLLGLATTNALELGIDVTGLDAVLLAGWPGTRASLWQQAGRAGRSGRDAVAVLVGRDDPLDAYLLQHPEAVFGAGVEATVLDPDNPYVLGPHLCAAAAEEPLTDADAARWFGPTAPGLLAVLGARGLLRRRPAGWFWTRPERAADLTDLRGTGSPPVRVVEDGTGRLLGTVDAGAAAATVHPGAVYVHQGATHVVLDLDLDAAVALVVRRVVDHWTQAREVSELRVRSVDRTAVLGPATICFGTVDVTSTVVGYLRRRLLSGEVLGESPLDLPPRHLRTRAVWWTIPPDALVAADIAPAAVPGAAHAAEHAAIGLLPLVATCDRRDVGGVSTARHPDTGQCTVFVYDGHPGGAGFAERGFATARHWLAATLDTIAACPCAAGCPSCVQSPSCGDGNEPLDKRAAGRLLATVLGVP